MVISVITITLQDKETLTNNLFIVIAIHLRQNYGTQTTLKWTLHFIMILTLAVYETYFTSQVVVPPVRDNSLGFVTLLKSGYKVAIPPNTTGYMLRFEDDFKRLGIQTLKSKKYTFKLKTGQALNELLYNKSLKLMGAEVVLPTDRRMRTTFEEFRNADRNSCRFARDTFSNQETYDLVHIMMRGKALKVLRVTAESGFFEGFWRNIRQHLSLFRIKRTTRRMLREGGHFVDSSETIIRLSNLESLFAIFGLLLGVSLLVFIAERLRRVCF